MGQPGSPVRANGGAGYQAIGFRDVLDARRAQQGLQAPSAAYPDGYLGTIQSRREDKLLDNLKNRLTSRSYQRGVHKGERIDPGDYYWPETFSPKTGLEYEARGLKWSAKGSAPVERLAHSGKVDAVDPQEMASLRAQYNVGQPTAVPTIDPIIKERMSRLLPGWK